MKMTVKDDILARIRTSIANTPDPPQILYSIRERDERDHTALSAFLNGR